MWHYNDALKKGVTFLTYLMYRYNISGCCVVQNVNYADNDTYQCYTCNKFGCDSSSGLLSVIGHFL